MVEPSKSMENTTPSIENIIQEIRNQDFETLAAFDADGRLLFDTTDHLGREVTMSAEQVTQFQEQNGVLIIHNHPGSTSFSAMDLYAEAKRNTQRAIVVTYDRLYILSPGRKGWGDPDELMSAHQYYHEYYEQLTVEDGNSAFGRVRWVYDQTVAAVAEDFGLDYWQIELKDLLCFRGIQVVTAR